MNFSPEELTAYATTAAGALGILVFAARKAAGAWVQIREALGLGGDSLHALVAETRGLALKNDRRNTDLDERQVAHEADSLQAREEMRAEIREIRAGCTVCKPLVAAAGKGG